MARLGSLRAAAASLGVSEPAVSSALAALRGELDDPLFVRAGGGIALTHGGHALARHAQAIVGLADQARREVTAAASGRRATGLLRVLATAAFAEHAAGPLLDAFTRRVPATQVDIVVESASDVARRLGEDAYDIALGARPAPSAQLPVEVLPFLRWQRIVVVAAGNPLAGPHASPLPLTALSPHRWLAGPAGVEETCADPRWATAFARFARAVTLPSEGEAVAAVAAGEGFALVLGHVVRDALRRGTLTRVPVAGTPVDGMWWASVPGHGQASPAARTLQRFVTSPDATAAMVTRSRRPARRHAPVKVALWS